MRKSVTVARVATPEHRVTIANVLQWHGMRSQHDQFAKDPTHNVLHILKALGPLAGVLEHRAHEEAEPEVEEKRYADLIIHTIWLVSALGFDPAALVAHRIWELGIGPKRTELPPEEREGVESPARGSPCVKRSPSTSARGRSPSSRRADRPRSPVGPNGPLPSRSRARS